VICDDLKPFVVLPQDEKDNWATVGKARCYWVWHDISGGEWHDPPTYRHVRIKVETAAWQCADFSQTTELPANRKRFEVRV